MSKLTKVITGLAGTLLIAASLNAGATPLKKKPKASTGMHQPSRVLPKPAATEAKPFAEHFVVFHISSGDGFSQKLVLNNAQNLQNFYGSDKVNIEIVAYGPGLRTLFGESSYAKRIKRMGKSGITFSACANTMKAMGREHGSLNKVAKVVPGGVVRI